MTSAEIRDELLSQHAALRGRLEAARLAVNRWASGEAPQARLREELAELASALRSHNLREERALRELIRAVDAWGPARLEIMEEAHVREHQHLFEAVLAVGEALDPREGVGELERLRTRLLEHMAREEETFLNASVLRDDDVAIDAQGG
jgi:iron-sulfur cluster repair protein YtfE (RIC family)